MATEIWGFLCHRVHMYSVRLFKLYRSVKALVLRSCNLLSSIFMQFTVVSKFEIVAQCYKDIFAVKFCLVLSNCCIKIEAFKLSFVAFQSALVSVAVSLCTIAVLACCKLLIVLNVCLS